MNALDQFRMNFYYAFRPNKPLLALRLAEAVFRSKVMRRPRLRYVDFAVDFKCNLHCKHCFATTLTQPGHRTMKVADYARVAHECMALGAVNFSFQGGEPLLFEPLPDIIQACNPDRNVISVTTNGTLLTEERILNLKRAGVDILTVSIDSGIAAEHDQFRCMDGAFHKALQGVMLALKHGLRVTLGTVVTHDNIHTKGFNSLIQLAEKLNVLLYFILPVPAGRWRHETSFLLTDDDLEFIYKLTKKSSYLRTDFQANLGPYGCGAAKEILYLTPYGDVFVCPFMHISLGNVFDEKVKDLRNRALANDYFKHYHNKCLVSTDNEFITKHLSKTFNATQLPISWETAFPDREEKEGAS